MTPRDTIALALALRGAWGIFSASRTFKATPGWTRLRWQIFLLELVFTSSCFLCAAGLRFGWFSPWMAAPLGASLLASIPLPCFWAAVNRIAWLHRARNALFLLLALLCFAIASEVLPLTALGL